MVFCNGKHFQSICTRYRVTILILIDGFLQYRTDKLFIGVELVTILILIDGFLQYIYEQTTKNKEDSHNPYFNRWFSAIQRIMSHKKNSISHNPYFNRWFSAITLNHCVKMIEDLSQSLF